MFLMKMKRACQKSSLYVLPATNIPDTDISLSPYKNTIKKKQKTKWKVCFLNAVLFCSNNISDLLWKWRQQCASIQKAGSLKFQGCPQYITFGSPNTEICRIHFPFLRSNVNNSNVLGNPPMWCIQQQHVRPLNFFSCKDILFGQTEECPSPHPEACSI